MATGPITAAVESAATSVGAGMLLGGFLGGVVALLFRWEPPRRDEFVFVATATVGVVAGAVMLLETVLR